MFVLASASKARQKLLDQIALRYKVIVSDFDETQVQELDPRVKVELLAKGKAVNALNKLKKENLPLNTFQALLGCDSLFEFEGKIFGKPINKEQLIARWKKMSGKSGLLSRTCLPIGVIRTFNVRPWPSTSLFKTPILINLRNSFSMNNELFININS